MFPIHLSPRSATNRHPASANTTLCTNKCLWFGDLCKSGLISWFVGPTCVTSRRKMLLLVGQDYMGALCSLILARYGRHPN